MTIIEGQRVLETKAVAKLAGCSPSNIRYLVLRKTIPAPVGKVGQSWVFDEAAIMAWLPDRNQRGNAAFFSSSEGRKRAGAHAQRVWTCVCGQEVRGNGGKSGHQRSCETYKASVSG